MFCLCEISCRTVERRAVKEKPKVWIWGKTEKEKQWREFHSSRVWSPDVCLFLNLGCCCKPTDLLSGRNTGRFPNRRLQL